MKKFLSGSVIPDFKKLGNRNSSIFNQKKAGSTFRPPGIKLILSYETLYGKETKTHSGRAGVFVLLTGGIFYKTVYFLEKPGAM